jgi:hypothetical protein
MREYRSRPPDGAVLLMTFGAEWFGRRNLAKARKKFDSLLAIHIKWSGMLLTAIYPHGVVVKFSGSP